MTSLELPCCSARWQASPTGGGHFHSLRCLKRPGQKVDARELARATRHPSEKPWPPDHTEYIDRDDWIPPMDVTG